MSYQQYFFFAEDTPSGPDDKEPGGDDE